MESQHTKRESQRARRENARPPGSSLANILQTKQTTSLRSQSTLAIRVSQDTSCTRRVLDGLVFSPRKLVAPTQSPELPAFSFAFSFAKVSGFFLSDTDANSAHEAVLLRHTTQIFPATAQCANRERQRANQCVCLRKLGASASPHGVKTTVWGGKCLTSRLTRSAALRPNPRPPRQPPYMALAAK